MANMDAASVEPMTEPISRPSSQDIRSTRRQKIPVSSAVTTTPRLDSSRDFTATGRALRQLVPKPP